MKIVSELNLAGQLRIFGKDQYGLSYNHGPFLHTNT